MNGRVQEPGMPGLVVEVEFFGVITSTLKDRIIRVPLPAGEPSTFRDVLETVAGEAGSVARAQLFGERNERLRAVRLVVDGRLVESLDETVPAGQPRVRVVVLSAVGGG